jgi:hypothetical protein
MRQVIRGKAYDTETATEIARGDYECVLALFQPDRGKELAFPQKARNCRPSLAAKPTRRSMSD